MSLPDNIRTANHLLNRGNAYHCWCSHCDERLVQAPRDGSLYLVYSHESINGVLGQYTGGYFSLCKKCDTLGGSDE